MTTKTPSFPAYFLSTLLLIPTLTTACGDDDGTAETGVEASTGTDASTSAAASTGSEESTGADESTGTASLEIIGEWYEALSPDDGITHVITEATWEQSSSFGTSLYHIDAFDDEARWVVARGDAANEFFPDLYSRFDWTWANNVLHYCTAVFDAATPEDAIAGAASNPDDLEMGCGGFPWSPLVSAQ
ncbi:hypothetical protein [Paraliomyxa miuraensis]|uniref:hypothetical protein n=1 Tax=Paraliomyxa miuraensis TaxID=376150 RepID=UPI00224E8949|nr:hypothetical protein [Paraliomyxa miuraensis]MCX4242482.1 hypothetical protein [Paraliomyxa miuraensis]